MTKRERQYHLIKKLPRYKTTLKKASSVPFYGTIGTSQSAPFITMANIEKAIAEIKASSPEPPNKMIEMVSWGFTRGS